MLVGEFQDVVRVTIEELSAPRASNHKITVFCGLRFEPNLQNDVARNCMARLFCSVFRLFLLPTVHFVNVYSYCDKAIPSCKSLPRSA